MDQCERDESFCMFCSGTGMTRDPILLRVMNCVHCMTDLSGAKKNPDDHEEST